MVELIPVRGLPLVRPDDDLTALLLKALASSGTELADADVLVVAQKVVSKSEGRLVRLDDVEPSNRAQELAALTEKDPRVVELILRESREVVRARPGLLIVEDNRGWVAANAGIDRSNIEQEDGAEVVCLLPVDPDASAARLRGEIKRLSGRDPAVIINDSHGRAWREGTVGVAIGVAGMAPLSDRRGDLDLTGYSLQHTVIGLADEIAAAASILMGPAAEGVPAVVVRGLHVNGEGKARDLQRRREMDLFR